MQFDDIRGNMGDGTVLYDKHFKLLQSENRRVRKKNLDELATVVSDKEFDITSDFLMSVKTFVYPCLNDSSEACRESAIQFTKTLVCTGRIEDIMSIIFIIHKRMANVTMIENSEEVKLLYVQLLRDIIKHNSQAIMPCLDDIVGILTKSVLDSCPAIKKDSCLCAAELARCTKAHFHMVAESFVEPLLKATNYHQSPIRITALESLSKILISVILQVQLSCLLFIKCVCVFFR